MDAIAHDRVSVGRAAGVYAVVLWDADQLLTRLTLGEDSRVRFMEVDFADGCVRQPRRQGIADELAAFGNTLGGALVFSVSDAGEVCPMTREMMDALKVCVSEICADSIDPPLWFTTQRLALPEGPKRWSYFYLYVLLDIFSRYVVGWMVAERESAALAATLIEQSCLKQGIAPQVLTLHSDRGAPMTSKCTAQLLADLGVTRSLSRPHVSDDNPFSEAQFKTLKYHPGFPGRFADIAAATEFCRSFFPWYNTEHRHGGIAMLTPEDVHHGRAQRILEQRERTLRAAWSQHPERFVHGAPKPQPLPKEVWINPPNAATTPQIAH